jgi:hypothetical protein
MSPWQGLSNSSERHPRHPWGTPTMGVPGDTEIGAISGAFLSPEPLAIPSCQRCTIRKSPWQGLRDSHYSEETHRNPGPIQHCGAVFGAFCCGLAGVSRVPGGWVRVWVCQVGCGVGEVLHQAPTSGVRTERQFAAVARMSAIVYVSKAFFASDSGTQFLHIVKT